jgi:hypothetical protein
MLSRRHFLSTAASASLAAALPAATQAQQPPAKKRLAVVTTLWNYRSHAWHMAERFLHGYPREGKWHQPPLEVVSAYVDQQPEGDLSKKRSAEFGFKIYPTVAEALRCGTDKLAVDAVLQIGEHGRYPTNAIGQKQYPRYELFMQSVKVFKEDGRTVPVFNDKHLSWNFAWAKEMVETAKSMNFPLLAGSSLPVTFRMPAIDLPLGAEIEEIVGVAFGATDIYDFHALEMMQSLAERRKGGETGVTTMHSLRGQPVWDAMAKGSFAAGGWSPRLFEACLSRSQTLAQDEFTSHRYPQLEQMKAWTKTPIAYRYEYADGVKATMLQLNGLVRDFTVAVKLKGQADPLSTLFYLPDNPNVTYSAALMSKAEEMFLTGKAPYRAERTLLTSGLTAAGLQSLADGKPVATPHLAVRYQPPSESQYWRT